MNPDEIIAARNYYTNAAIEALKRRRNIGAYFDPYSDPNYGCVVFFNTADNNKVTTVVCNDPGERELLHAFTTGDIALSDNFDKESGKTIPVENTVFGAAKVLLEMHQIDLFCKSDCINLYDTTRALLGGASMDPNNFLLVAMIENPGPENKDQRQEGRYRLMAQTLKPLISSCDQEVITLAEKKGYRNDPLYQACIGGRGRMGTMEHVAATATPEIVINLYRAARLERLPLLPETNPRLAKLAFGRKVVFPMIEELWIKNKLAVWAVFYARRYFMRTNPTLAYLFCLLNVCSTSCEVSDKDDDWAYKVKPEPPANMGSLCSVKSDPRTAQLLAEIRAAAPVRKLGWINNLLAKHLITGSPAPFSAPTAEQANQKLISPEHAKQKLIEIGWKNWFDHFVVPICARPDVRIFDNEPTLPDEMLFALQGMSKQDAWQEIRKIANQFQ